jgi:hypothetical protein
VAVVAQVDDEALARVGGDLGASLDLDRLRADGWIVEGPTRGADGITELRVHHGFSEPAEAGTLIDELAGRNGPFHDFRLERSSSLWRTRWAFRGEVDLSKGARGLGAGAPSIDDAGLTQLREQLGASLDRLIQVRVGVRLPGDVSSNATTKADNGAVWKVHLGDEPLDLRADGSSTRTSSVVLAVLGVAAAVVLLVTLLIRLAIRRTA